MSHCIANVLSEELSLKDRSAFVASFIASRSHKPLNIIRRNP